MNITFRCPCCDQTAARVELALGARVLACPHCQAERELPTGALADGGLQSCLVCPSHDLFLRKDFPQRLGVILVLLGFAGFLIANYYYRPYLAFGFLFATAALDVMLYLIVGDALVCYRCEAHYRGVSNLVEYGAFQLETHERYRQLAARMAASPTSSLPLARSSAALASRSSTPAAAQPQTTVSASDPHAAGREPDVS